MLNTFGTGKVINLICKEQLIPDAPLLLFGTHTDSSELFDATSYLNKNKNLTALSVEDFFAKFDYQINAIADSNRLDKQNLVYINAEGHQLINGSLCYLFLSYTNPQFCSYFNDMIGDLMTFGMAISDTYLLDLIDSRFTPELLNKILHGRRKAEEKQENFDI